MQHLCYWAVGFNYGGEGDTELKGLSKPCRNK